MTILTDGGAVIVVIAAAATVVVAAVAAIGVAVSGVVIAGTGHSVGVFSAATISARRCTSRGGSLARTRFSGGGGQIITAVYTSRVGGRR